MRTTITLTLDAELLHAAKAVAAEEGRSLNALPADTCRRRARAAGFTQARERALARLREGIDLGWSVARSRDELHDR